MALKEYTSITYYNTKLFDNIKSMVNNQKIEKDIIIPNVSNIDSTIQNDFLIKATNEYPSMQGTINLQKYPLGTNSITKVYRANNNNVYFCQMFADKRKKPRNINYIHLVNCMIDIRNFCLNMKKKEDKTIEIHAPRFGLDRSGGKWSTIVDLIEDCWSGIPVFVYKDY